MNFTTGRWQICPNFTFLCTHQPYNTKSCICFSLVAEIIGPSKHELTLQQCTGKVYVVPDVTLNECAWKAQKGNFSALVHLETKAGKGCDRDTFEASDLYITCGASGFIDLLPEPGTGREWTKKLKMATELNGVTSKLTVAQISGCAFFVLTVFFVVQ